MLLLQPGLSRTVWVDLGRWQIRPASLESHHPCRVAIASLWGPGGVEDAPCETKQLSGISRLNVGVRTSGRRQRNLTPTWTVTLKSLSKVDTM